MSGFDHMFGDVSTVSTSGDVNKGYTEDRIVNHHITSQYYCSHNYNELGGLR